jgi:hypothetical protein
MGKPEGRRTTGRPWGRYEDNVKTYLQEIECKHVDLIHLAQDSDAWRAVLHVNGLLGSIKCT